MTEFKFHCPQCGRQIQCDVSYATSQINCPACQKAIVVPAAPATLVSNGQAAQIRKHTLRNAAIAGVCILLVAGALLLFFYFKQGQSLAGDWTYGGQPCQIVQDGEELTFINEQGMESKGRFTSETAVVATDWEGGLVGNLSKNKKKIMWRNGTVWIRAK